jgi:flagellar biosynthetic protein FliR
MRIGAFLLMLPFFSLSDFPPTMRIALGAIAAFLVAPVLPAFHSANLDIVTLISIIVKEISIGLLLGFVARLIFFTVELAGAIISTEMGLSMASVFDPLTSSAGQVPSTILVYLATMVMLTLNLHHWMLLGLVRTYFVLPIGTAHLNVALFETVIARTSDIFTLGLQMAAPVIAVSFVVTLVFALLGRAVPQMNVFSESFGFRIAAGLIVFGFTLQIAAQYVHNYLDRLPDDLLAIAQMLGGAH